MVKVLEVGMENEQGMSGIKTERGPEDQSVRLDKRGELRLGPGSWVEKPAVDLGNRRVMSWGEETEGIQ